jgi:dGTPase
VDDGLRSELISLEQLLDVPLFKRHWDIAHALYPAASERRRINETVRRMINTLVLDLVHASQANIDQVRPGSPDEVRRLPSLIAFSAGVEAESLTLKRFLRDALYQHYRVQRMSTKGRRIVRELFQAFIADARLMPPQYQAKAEADRARAVADYISGMTDRYAMREHRRLFAVEEL